MPEVFRREGYVFFFYANEGQENNSGDAIHNSE
jgi:hypothetical protein